ncbi:HAMP domain-containing histidine kinase [Halosquirtibacter laminarini]|uniref:HAMP domain-containing histidine kinase n=1 Tax=Halosquirtibacter laminarini TaxID=3374600 RepID=A0AC61NE08_9BACT|nr:HAMP domain-containing histidine kinase [Prolixibacteraceae bacterium]
MWNRRVLNFIVLAFLFVTCVGTLWFTQVLVDKLKKEEHQKVLNIAGATRLLSSNSSNFSNDYSFVIDIIQNNESIPLIVLDEKENIVTSRNVIKNGQDSTIIFDALSNMKLHYIPIEITLSGDKKNYIYYNDSIWLKRLRFFPFIQILLISLIFFIGWWFYRRDSKMERNLLWVGLAKETAHQLGTPISALGAWVDLLEMEENNSEISIEMRKDVSHLSNIAERFSMIGSDPTMEVHSLHSLIDEIVIYFEKRIPRKVQVHNFDKIGTDSIPMNKVLLGWVFENLIKNSLDSIDGKGEISIKHSEDRDYVFIDIADTGKGIPQKLQKKIFKTGFSTKPRGWGLGLSLARRIVVQYHDGKIKVLKSVEGEGTIFRVSLRKQ